MCECKHFTDGQDCEKCLPFYNDAPWGRATSKNVHECKGKFNEERIHCMHWCSSKWHKPEKATKMASRNVTFLVGHRRELLFCLLQSSSQFLFMISFVWFSLFAVAFNRFCWLDASPLSIVSASISNSLMSAAGVWSMAFWNREKKKHFLIVLRRRSLTKHLCWFFWVFNFTWRFLSAQRKPPENVAGVHLRGNFTIFRNWTLLEFQIESNCRILSVVSGQL